MASHSAAEEMDWVDTAKEEFASSTHQKAVQIVKINKEGTNFELDEQALTEILSSVPAEMKVSIVSVVGAFRTGKSFLLDLFLRYLRYGEMGGQVGDEDSTEWVFTGVDGSSQTKLEGNSNINVESNLGSSGFSWRAGKERNTTGIWMWGHPFFRTCEGSDEKIAVFVVDTQGMFDSETSQMLTASIFGLSTLLSSYQIYNVDKRIQEDNLQHLALFTEYGRMALLDSPVEEDVEGEGKGKEQDKPVVKKMVAKELEKDDDGECEQTEIASKEVTEKKDEGESEANLKKPFQQIEFLVRDWQNFTDEEDEEKMVEEMKEYLDELLSSRTQKDLAETREQIFSCFEDISCFLLPHPGFEVTKKTFDGTISKIRPEFLKLVSKYVNRVFYKNLTLKKIHGNVVTCQELLMYMKVYVNLFHEARIFPEAKTLLEATAEANNINIKEKSLMKYKAEMKQGIGANFLPEEELKSLHRACLDASLKLFDTGANMGRRSAILNYRNLLMNDVTEEYLSILALNRERDPYKNIGLYMVPAGIALGLFTFRFTQDLFCYEEFGYDLPLYDCKHVSITVTQLYWALIIFMFIMTIATGQAMFERTMGLIQAVKVLYAQNNSAGTKEKQD